MDERQGNYPLEVTSSGAAVADNSNSINRGDEEDDAVSTLSERVGLINRRKRIRPKDNKKDEGTGAASKFLVLARIGNHLANERTLLAWIRTSLAMVGLGAALARIDEVTGGVGAVIFICAGLFCLILGTQRYYKVKNALLKFDKREYELSSVSLMRMGVRPFVVAVMLLLALLVAWFLFKLVSYCLDHYT